jgi:hypothetical protein
MGEMFGQEGADEDAENNNNEDDTGEPIETEDKEEQAPVERPRKTSKFMTKYERARILGTRALQIRFIHFFPNKPCHCGIGLIQLSLCC